MKKLYFLVGSTLSIDGKGEILAQVPLTPPHKEQTLVGKRKDEKKIKNQKQSASVGLKTVVSSSPQTSTGIRLHGNTLSVSRLQPAQSGKLSISPTPIHPRTTVLQSQPLVSGPQIPSVAFTKSSSKVPPPPAKPVITSTPLQTGIPPQRRLQSSTGMPVSKPSSSKSSVNDGLAQIEESQPVQTAEEIHQTDENLSDQDPAFHHQDLLEPGLYENSITGNAGKEQNWLISESPPKPIIPSKIPNSKSGTIPKTKKSNEIQKKPPPLKVKVVGDEDIDSDIEPGGSMGFVNKRLKTLTGGRSARTRQSVKDPLWGKNIKKTPYPSPRVLRTRRQTGKLPPKKDYDQWL